MKRTWENLLATVLGVALLVGLGCVKEPAEEPGTSEPASTTDETEPSDGEKPAEPGPAEPATTTATEGESTMSVTSEPYGEMPDGTVVQQFTLTNNKGMKVTVITYGAIITSVEVPDRNGKLANVALFCDSLDDYISDSPYFGCVAGRYANRIAKGKFTLDGTEYTLATNNGPNHLHGGDKGFDKHVWEAATLEDEDMVGVSLKLVSPDGEEGYPGELTATVNYTLSNDNELTMSYEATTDKPTVINLTNHSYWNLAGAGSGDVLKQELMINADEYLPVDDTLIPLGAPAPVADTPMDFTKPMAIGSRIDAVEGGYDHCYVLNKEEPGALSMVARLVDPSSGRTMEIFSTEPGVQFYSGNFLDGTVSGGGVDYQKHYGLCLETQHFPDSPNQPDYPSVVLRPGETYETVTMHRFGVEE